MRYRTWIALLLIALGASIGLGVSRAYYQAGGELRSHLPLVANGSAESSIITLVEDDTTLVTAAVIPDVDGVKPPTYDLCRVVVVFINRTRGNLLQVTEHVGYRLVDIPMPPELTQEFARSEAPQFVPPGPKHAAGFPLVVCGRLRVYFNGRDPDDLNGRFKLKSLDMPIPAAPSAQLQKPPPIRGRLPRITVEATQRHFQRRWAPESTIATTRQSSEWLL